MLCKISSSASLILYPIKLRLLHKLSVSYYNYDAFLVTCHIDLKNSLPTKSCQDCEKFKKEKKALQSQIRTLKAKLLSNQDEWVKTLSNITGICFIYCT